MLPGFRFLFVAIVMSMSMLVFGLGAATLFRAAHQEFASTPSWRAAPETMFAQQEVTPTLALLRFDAPPAAEQKPAADAAPTVTEVRQPAPDATPVTPAEPKGPDLAAVTPPERAALDVPSPPAASIQAPATMAAPTEADSSPKPSETTAAMPPAASATPVETASTPKPETPPSATGRRRRQRRRTTDAAERAGVSPGCGAVHARPGQGRDHRTRRTAGGRARHTEPSPAPVAPLLRNTPEPATAASEPDSPPDAAVAETVPTMIAMLATPPMPHPRPAKASHANADTVPPKSRTERRKSARGAPGGSPSPHGRARPPRATGGAIPQPVRGAGDAALIAGANAGQAGPVATGGPPGSPHSAHEPS